MPASVSSPRCARCAPLGDLWDEICLERTGVEDPIIPPLPLWRGGGGGGGGGGAGESPGLKPKQQPRNNVYRILNRDAAVTLSKERSRPRRAVARLGTKRLACYLSLYTCV